MPATSFVEMANSGLIKLGASTIISLDLNTDSSKEAKLCNLRYERCRDIVLRAHPWNFAIKRSILAPDVTAPAFDYTYLTPFPSDAIRILGIGPSGTDYRIEGRNFVSDNDAIECRYVYQVTDPTIIDDLAIECMALRLAADLAYPLMQSSSLQKNMWDMYKDALRQAKSVDGKEELPQEMEMSLWLDARFGDPGPFRSNR